METANQDLAESEVELPAYVMGTMHDSPHCTLGLGLTTSSDVYRFV